MILQREREREREEHCNSLVYLIALDFVRSSLSMIKSLEKSYETLAEGFIISLVSFLSRFIEASATIRAQNVKEVLFRILLFHSRPCVLARMYLYVRIWRQDAVDSIVEAAGTPPFRGTVSYEPRTKHA